MGFKMELSNRIKQLRDIKGWTQQELADYSGVSIDSIKGYESKKTKNITTENLNKIAKAFDLNISNFYNNDLSVSEIEKCPLGVHKSSVSDKKSVVTPPNFKMSQDNFSVPYFDDVYASAGGGYINEENPPRMIEFSKSFLRDYLGTVEFSRLNVIKSKGDSMEPTIPKNALLFVRLGQVKEGHICVVRVEDELYVKRLQKRPVIKLLSDNPDYDPITLHEDEDFELIGTVLGYIKRF